MLKKLLLLMFISFLTVGAIAQQTKEEIQKKQQELQRELSDLNKTLSEIKKNRKQSIGQLELVRRKINAREQLIRNLNQDMRLIDNNIYTTNVEISRLRRELDTLKQSYAKSLVFAYKNRSNYDYLSFLFSATNFNDAIKRMAYLKSYRQYRETQVNNIRKTEQIMQQKAASLNNSKQEKTSNIQQQNQQLTVLESDKKEKDQVVKQLQGQEQGLSKGN
jgi:peptidoglycan hydrolase CwlO-like protein